MIRSSDQTAVNQRELVPATPRATNIVNANHSTVPFTPRTTSKVQHRNIISVPVTDRKKPRNISIYDQSIIDEQSVMIDLDLSVAGNNEHLRDLDSPARQNVKAHIQKLQAQLDSIMSGMDKSKKK